MLTLLSLEQVPDPVKDTDTDTDIVYGTFWLTNVVLVFLLAVTTLRAATLEGKFRSAAKR